MSSTPCRTRKKSSVSSCLCQTNSPFNFTTMTSQLLNRAIARGEKCSENVASFSDKSMLSLMGPSDIVADGGQEFESLWARDFGMRHRRRKPPASRCRPSLTECLTISMNDDDELSALTLYWPDIRSLMVVSRSAATTPVSANAAPDFP